MGLGWVSICLCWDLRVRGAESPEECLPESLVSGGLTRPALRGACLGPGPPGSQVRGPSASPQPKPGTPPRYGRDLPGWQPQPLPHTWPPCLPGRSEVSLRAWGPAWHSSQRSPGTRELSTRWGLRPCAGRGHPGPAESPQPCHCSLFSSGPRVWAFPGAPQASPGTPRFPPVM